jgi:hypothetical protein
MPAAVEMQELPETGARLAAAAMAPAGAILGEESGLLEQAFHKRVAERDGVLPPRELVEMPPIEPALPLAIQT